MVTTTYPAASDAETVLHASLLRVQEVGNAFGETQTLTDANLKLRAGETLAMTGPKRSPFRLRRLEFVFRQGMLVPDLIAEAEGALDLHTADDGILGGSPAKIGQTVPAVSLVGCSSCH